LETKYKGCVARYKCICKEGHIINLLWRQVGKRKHLCRKCNDLEKLNKNTNEMKKIHEYCETFGGKCLETKYKGCVTTYKCICKEGHIINLLWHKIGRRKHLCKKCNDLEKLNKNTNEMKKIHKYCEDKNGKCSDHLYMGTNYNYNCICENEHNFKLKWSKGKSIGTWCPRCNESVFETNVKICLEQLTNRKFIKIRPDWLKNPKTNRRLELDLYCEKLKIAVECQGLQHYKKISRFKMTDTDLKSQQYRDSIKRKLCKEKGIILIEISYSCNQTIKQIENVVKEKIKIYNIIV